MRCNEKSMILEQFILIPPLLAAVLFIGDTLCFPENIEDVNVYFTISVYIVRVSIPRRSALSVLGCRIRLVVSCVEDEQHFRFDLLLISLQQDKIKPSRDPPHHWLNNGD